MRFGREFVSKMIPEWQEAYIDYAYLKTILQDIQATRRISVSNSQTKPSFARNLTRRYTRDASVSENHVIVFNTVPPSDYEHNDMTYETAFLKAGEPGGDSEAAFFRTLDREFNKVNSFYSLKVEKARYESLALTRQMEALVAFRHRVMEKKPCSSDSVSVDISALSSKSKEQKVTLRDLIKKEEAANESILEGIRMNKRGETPLSAIKTILKVHKQEELKFTRQNLKKVEERLQRAFIEFYQKLAHLKNYSFLNTSAVSKIMKKYDKISARNAAKQYMEMVDSSYLTSSDEVHKLMIRVEFTFIQHFSDSNRRQGMSLLRPKENKELHRTTFSTGFFFGCAISLIIALALIIHARNIMGTPGQRTYMETMFPLYRFFGFVVLHVVMYAANIYFWRIYRVNYSFIFGFKQGTELGYRHVLLLSFGLGTVSLCAVLLNLDMEMDSQTKDYRIVTELIPLFLLALVFAITLCPFNILYRSSRFFFLTVLFRCIAAPFYTVPTISSASHICTTSSIKCVWQVNLPDFFLADQLTSQRGCTNSFLRDKLLVRHKSVYYAAMVLNVLLRLVWLQTVLDLKFSFLHRETLVALLACLEIIRREVLLIRLENEHLNNVGKFRAFKSVPLPFNYQEDRDQDS
ncbi:hypothetical protein Bca4012_054478 [Brassica carinata]